MPAQPREARRASLDPDVGVERFHVATDSMARVVRRVRGEDPGPPPPRSRRRRARTALHPAAGGRRRAAPIATLPGDPRRRPDATRRRAAVIVLVLAVVVLLVGLLALAGSPGEDDVGTTPGTDAPAPDAGAPPATAAPGGSAASEPTVTVDHPAPGRVEVRAPRAEVTAEASEQCWLRVVLDGTVPTDLVLAAGDRETFAAFGHLEVRVGNPGGITVTASGAPVDLGEHGGQPVDLVVIADDG